MKREWATLVVALTVVLAGCGGFAGTDTATEPPVETATPTEASAGTPTPSPTAAEPQEKVTVVGGELPFDAATVYRRVVELHGLTLEEAPAVTIHVRPPPGAGGTPTPRPFEELLGIEPTGTDFSDAGRARIGNAWVNPEVLAGPTQIERILAHELTHVIHLEQNASQRTNQALAERSDLTDNEVLLWRTVFEGAATYVEYQYVAEYLDRDPPTWAEWRANRSQAGAYGRLYYHFGARYIADRVDSAAELGIVFDDPPLTFEQLLHGDDPGEKDPLALDVAVNESGSWYVTDGRTWTYGELFVRFILEGELTLDRAADAAAGWGNDELVTVRHPDPDQEPGYAWVLRWDSPTEADEFAAAMRDFLDGHAIADDGRWRTDDGAFRLVRASDETVVLLAGNPAFVGNASAAGGEGNVTVTIEEE